jgi:hypothetical protein
MLRTELVFSYKTPAADLTSILTAEYVVTADGALNSNLKTTLEFAGIRLLTVKLIL